MPSADKLVGVETSTGKKQGISVGSGLNLTGNTLSASAFTENTVTTVDATATTIATIAIAPDTAVLIEAYVVAKEPSGGAEHAAYVIRALVFRTGTGAATLQGTNQNDFTRETTGGMNAEIITSGNNAIIRVTGKAATTINWKSQHRTVSVS
jgi:hypothetical protein